MFVALYEVFAKDMHKFLRNNVTDISSAVDV